MPGPVPKKLSQLQRRNKSTTATIFVDKKPLKGIPELPKRRLKWRPEVLNWWNEIWSSPMAQEFIKVDIHGLYILADLIDRYWRKPTPSLAGEIRLQRQCFGLTPIDRRRLQWEIEKAETAAERSKKLKEKGRKIKDLKIDPRDVLKQVN